MNNSLDLQLSQGAPDSALVFFLCVVDAKFHHEVIAKFHENYAPLPPKR